MQIKTYSDRKAMSRAAARQAAESFATSFRRAGWRASSQRQARRKSNSSARWLRCQGSTGRASRCFTSTNTSVCPIDHPASFRRYLLERLIRPTGIGAYHLLDGERDPQQLTEEAGRAIRSGPIDVAFVGIGENGHLAFNDPPADFDTEQPYLVVKLDEACRRQQVGEGWFKSIEDVPAQAISMSIRQILKAARSSASCPTRARRRRFEACLEGPCRRWRRRRSCRRTQRRRCTSTAVGCGSDPCDARRVHRERR